MSTDLATFLAPGSLVGTVTQRVCEYLSVQDLLQHIASVVNASDQNDAAERNSGTPEITLEERKKRLEAGNLRRRDYPASSAGFSPRSRDVWQQEGQLLENIPNEGGGDEAGGGKRSCLSHVATSRQTDVRELCSGSSSTSGQASREASRRRCIRDEEDQRREGEEKHDGLLGLLIGLGTQPLATVGALGGSLASLLGGLPLLALLRWAAERAASVLGVTFRVALLPYDMTRGAVSYVVGAVEAILDVATEVRRHLCPMAPECRHRAIVVPSNDQSFRNYALFNVRRRGARRPTLERVHKVPGADERPRGVSPSMRGPLGRDGLGAVSLAPTSEHRGP